MSEIGSLTVSKSDCTIPTQNNVESLKNKSFLLQVIGYTIKNYGALIVPLVDRKVVLLFPFGFYRNDPLRSSLL